jgi:CspA family cold shock protein
MFALFFISRIVKRLCEKRGVKTPKFAQNYTILYFTTVYVTVTVAHIIEKLEKYMAFRDQALQCKECGNQFIYRVEEQRQQVNIGLEQIAPDLCPDCRLQDDATPGLRPGIIKWYRDDKHFGFVTQADGSEIFFHRSAVEEDAIEILHEDVPVWYEVTKTDRGLQAINIHIRE